MGETPIRTLLVTKGHAYDYSFLELFDANPEIDCTHVEQPAAQVILQPEHAREYAAVVFYDMSGIVPPSAPPPAYQAAIEALLERGTGVVMLNHGLISWPAWPLWREISGTSFMLTQGSLDGCRVPGSGYRGGAHGPLPNATLRVKPATPGHPVLQGLEDGFEVTDELYLKTAEFEARVVPLLRGDYAFVADNFTPPPLAPPEEQARWTHPPGSDLLAWAKATRNSPVFATDLGDGPAAYANPDFQRLLANAIRWVASEDARAWAASQR